MNIPSLLADTHAGPGAQSVKQSMRDRIRSERRARDPRQAESDAWGLTAVALEQPEIADARCVAVYVSSPPAPDTLPLRRALRAGGVRVLLPVLRDDGQLDWSDDTLVGPVGEGPMHRLTPDAISRAQAVLVPALAVDTLGNRLGQGTGFYDRTLTAVHATATVFALVHENEVLDAAVEPVPAEPHDQPVDAVLTTNRCLRLPRRRRH